MLQRSVSGNTGIWGFPAVLRILALVFPTASESERLIICDNLIWKSNFIYLSDLIKFASLMPNCTQLSYFEIDNAIHGVTVVT